MLTIRVSSLALRRSVTRRRCKTGSLQGRRDGIEGAFELGRIGESTTSASQATAQLTGGYHGRGSPMR